MNTDTHKTESGSGDDMSIFRPPMMRSAAALNRALFSKTFNLAAARINDPRNIAKYRKDLTKSKDILILDRASTVIDDPDPAPAVQGRKCIILRPGISASGTQPSNVHVWLLIDFPIAPETWSDVIKDGVERKDLGVVPYDLVLDYDYWSSRTCSEDVLGM